MCKTSNFEMQDFANFTSSKRAFKGSKSKNLFFPKKLLEPQMEKDLSAK